jgi:hypothetical protein
MVMRRPTTLMLVFAVIYAVATLGAQKPGGDAKARA